MSFENKKPGDLTFSIIKPDIVRRGKIGEVLSIIEKEGLRVVASRMVFLTMFEIEALYEAHRDKPFFGEIVDFMTSYNCVVQVLQGHNAVERYRKIMGHTDPIKAEEGTIRKMFSKDISENSVHGSDSDESAEREIQIFFSSNEIFLYDEE